MANATIDDFLQSGVVYIVKDSDSSKIERVGDSWVNDVLTIGITENFSRGGSIQSFPLDVEDGKYGVAMAVSGIFVEPMKKYVESNTAELEYSVMN
ncbi:hypothetical protein HOA92_00415 [archaeon]|nr:hypothetical protein [archaeon]MBT6761481.1 hypothetical protein [archaeon]